MVHKNNTHSQAIGYLMLVFGFMGAHRFYFGKKVTGALWFMTLGLLGIGWIVDFFLIPNMDAEAEHRYVAGSYSYTVAWILQTFFGVFGLHRFYLGQWISGLIWLCTFGVFGLGYLHDYFFLNEMVDERNRSVK